MTNTTPAAQAVPAIGSAWPGIEGSVYAGVARGEEGKPDYHLVLLADKPASRLNWKDALAWAESVGGRVPTRDESALLYAFVRDQFEFAWHWTGTQYDASYAWSQYFGGGYQDDGDKLAEARCRAVRSFPLQSFNSLEG